MSLFRSLLLTLCFSGVAFAGGVEDRIRDLGSDDFKKREAATAWLSEQGSDAAAKLQEAAKDKDPEVRWRAEKALEAIKARGGRASTGQAQPKQPRAPEPPQTAEAPPGGSTQIPELGDALERARQRLKDVEEQMRRVRPGIDEFMKGFGGNGSGDVDFDKIFQEMERRFRDLDRPDQGGPGGGMMRDFWSFRFKDGKWELVRPEDPVVSRIGVRTQPAPPVLRAQLKLGDAPDGVVVEEVTGAGIAAQAGLQQWDLILTVDGKPVSAEADLQALLPAGDHKIGIVRAGARQELAVTTTQPAAAGELRPSLPGPTPMPPPMPPKADPPKKDEIRKY